MVSRHRRATSWWGWSDSQWENCALTAPDKYRQFRREQANAGTVTGDILTRRSVAGIFSRWMVSHVGPIYLRDLRPEEVSLPRGWQWMPVYPDGPLNEPFGWNPSPLFDEYVFSMEMGENVFILSDKVTGKFWWAQQIRPAILVDLDGIPTLQVDTDAQYDQTRECYASLENANHWELMPPGFFHPFNLLSAANGPEQAQADPSAASSSA